MQASLHLCNVCPQHKGYCTCAAFSTYAQHVRYPNLNSKATGFTLLTDRWRVDSSQWTKGRSLNMTSHFFVPLMVPLQSVVPLHSRIVINVNVQILNSKPTDFTLSTVHSSQWTKGRSLNTASQVYVHVQSKTPYCSSLVPSNNL